MTTEEQHNAAIQEGRKATRAATLERIATDTLLIRTLDVQHSDQLDFHDLSVWAIKAALNAAYEAGWEDGKHASAG